MDIAVIVSVIGGAAGVIFGIVTLFRNKKQDDEAGGKQQGYIKSSVDDVKKKQDRLDAQTVNFLRELSEVKESAKSAHKRIDTLEERLNH